MLIIKGTPQIHACRDGGSLEAYFKTIFGGSYLLTLPIKWEGASRNDMRTAGYKAPELTQYKNERKISKANGKPFYVTKNVAVPITTGKALAIARKLYRAAKTAEDKELCMALLNGIENNDPSKNS